MIGKARRGSLESRLCVLVMGLLFALLLAIGHIQMQSQARALKEARNEKYQVLSKILLISQSFSDTGEGSLFCRKMASRLMEADTDVAYVVVSDHNGKVVFADMRETSPREKRMFAGMRLGSLMTFIHRSMLWDGFEFSKTSIPTMLAKGRPGTITVGFSSRSTDMALEEMQARLLAVFAVAFIIGLLGSVLLARSFVTPLRHLVEAARAITADNLDVSVPENTTAELGEVSAAFNRMVKSLRENRERLIERANTDSLTGLYNHRFFQDRLRSELTRAERYGRPVSMIMLDIDHFKNLNDAYGHPVGDAVLVEMARILQSDVRRDIDIVARYGGEEFAVILPETDVVGAEEVAERIRVSVQRHCFSAGDGETVPVTVSLGVAAYPEHSLEREGLIMAADLAMYQSKSTGRNRTTVFSKDSRADEDTDPYKLYLLLHAPDFSTIEAMAAAVDAKGKRPPGFSKAVEMHAVALAEELALPEKLQEEIRITSLLYDIGKLGVSDSVLNKEGPLTDRELEMVRSHTTIGHAIVQRSVHLRSILPGILHHHECWNGSGYPSHLKGENIPIIARIIAVVDAYHAMRTDRVHSKAKTHEQAIAELRRCAGTQFDPQVVEAYIRILGREEQCQAAA